MTGDTILVLNAGSSSLKFALYRAAGEGEPGTPLCRGKISGIGHAPRFVVRGEDGGSLVDETLGEGLGHDALIARLIEWIEGEFAGSRIAVAGHRIVHGGERFRDAVAIDPDIRQALERLVPLAPLHQPHNLHAVDVLARLHPDLLQVAAFDTGFHRDNGPVASAYALPEDLSPLPIRRYGFHGLSYEFIAGQAVRLMGAKAAAGRMIVAHLGSGASLCAIRDGRSVATTMGFTALDGLPMGTRSGAIDPGVVLYLIQSVGMSAEAVADLLYHRSGLLGVSGVSDDMRSLLASDDERARFAVDLFVYRICREIGSLVAALGGLDALVFTAGIGENAPEIRRRVCEGSKWLGMALDEGANLSGGPMISTTRSEVALWVIPTDEESVIARHAWRILRG